MKSIWHFKNGNVLCAQHFYNTDGGLKVNAFHLVRVDSSLLNSALIVSVVLSLSACATVAGKPEATGFADAYEATGRTVERLLVEDRRGEAVAVLQAVTSRFPLHAEPWVRLASLHFDAGEYGHAIVSADEALQRDPASQLAKSIRAVSGLRVATSSLVDLRAEAPLTGSTRADATRLAIVLRGTLGEEVLVPEAVPAPKRVTRRASAAAAGRAASVVRERGATEGANSSAPAVNGDPFSVLK
jgi:hypothetical protein